jgi:hypothetical protein
MLFREIIAVYCGNRTKHTHEIGRKTAEFVNAMERVTYRYQEVA